MKKLYNPATPALHGGTAFAMGEANREKEMMVFDWDEAAKRIKKSGCKTASAGLRAYWVYTGGTIFEDEKPVFDQYTYLSSTWAVPELNLDGEIVPCYKMESELPGFNAITKWPKSALKILNS
jgi:hypothetical protein